MPYNQSVSRIITWLAGIVMSVMVIIFPGGYLLISYQHLAGTLELEAEINSRIIAQVINTNPEFWEFEQIRLEEYLGWRPSEGYAEVQRILNTKNEVVAEKADHLALPVITRFRELKDSGVVVGKIEISRSLRPLLFKTALIAILMLPLGAAAFLILRFLPIRAISRTEEALRQSSERFTKAFQANPVAIGITTLEEGRYLDVNNSFLKLFGFSREEVLGRTSLELDLWPNPEERLKTVQALQEQHSLPPIKIARRTKSGELKEGLGSFELIELEGKTCILVIFQDLTELKSLQEQLLQAQKMEAVGTLAGGIAHDFNNLLTAVMGNLELAKIKISRGQSVESHLEEIEKMAQRAAALTRHLLAFSRRQIIQPVPHNLNDTLTEMSKILPHLLGEHIKLELHLESDIEKVKVDPVQIEQVIMNLCVNARDAMPTGGKLTLTTRNVKLDKDYAVERYGIKGGRYVMLEVTDTGCGMDPAILERIFEPFFTTKEVGKGTGLGLAMVYGIVKQHQGYVHAYSEPGRGSTFKVYLPCEEEKEAAPEKAEAPKAAREGKETILVAEDEEGLRETIQNLLEMLGYTVLAARDGQEAVEIYEREKNQIDLVILDAVMPRMGGKEAAERIYQLNPRQKILFSSGYSKDSIHQAFILPGEMNFIQKPYTAKALAQKVREVLEKD